MHMNRRLFNKRLVLALAAGTGLIPRLSIARGSPGIVRPPALRPGSLVGLIAPGGYVDDAIIDICVKNLESLGFKVRLGTNIRAAHGGYAGTVFQRLNDLHDVFFDKDVKAIWTARGGSGCTALLPQIQYSRIRQHPKILIGYSDITALHLALYRQAGLVTFHGPVAWSTFSDYSVNHMLSVLMDPQPEYTIHMSIENERKVPQQPQFAMQTIRGGVAEGRLIGGNLSVLCALIGTPYAAEVRQSLLFLEEVGEAPYRVDRMLTQLQQSQNLKTAAGVMLGVFQKNEQPQEERRPLALMDVVNEQFGALPIPSVYGYSFGHIPHQFTLPVGIRARLNTQEQTLTLLEPAVRG
jgi:muramoyltetrapeptide carboxypeptidase